jgi:hypothetical protein
MATQSPRWQKKHIRGDVVSHSEEEEEGGSPDFEMNSAGNKGSGRRQTDQAEPTPTQTTHREAVIVHVEDQILAHNGQADEADVCDWFGAACTGRREDKK